MIITYKISQKKSEKMMIWFDVMWYQHLDCFELWGHDFHCVLFVFKLSFLYISGEVFLESLFHIQFVSVDISFFCVIDFVRNHMIYVQRWKWKIFKTRTKKRVMIFCCDCIEKDHHCKMGMLIVQNGCGWGGVFIFICLPNKKWLISKCLKLKRRRNTLSMSVINVYMGITMNITNILFSLILNSFILKF